LLKHPVETINIEANLKDIGEANHWLTGLFEQYHVPSNKAKALDHCLDEVLMNILMHGGPEVKDSRISLSFCSKDLVNRTEVNLTITDSGIPFNPMKFTPKELPKTLDEVVPGGLGVGIIQKMSDRLEYEREDGKNVLTLTVQYP
jgi:anti-sigma regulatory factor (Ser/Thr protein kinase)